MHDEISILQDEDPGRQHDRGGEPRPVAEVLVELLAHDRHRFPDSNISVVKTSAA